MEDGKYRYNTLSPMDRALIDEAVAQNLEFQQGGRGFGTDPTLAAKNRATFVANGLAYFSEPENLQRLRDNAQRRQQSHTGRVTGERKDKGPPQVGG